MIEVYHGGTEAINHPLVSAGREGLDFGKGFYVTLLREQAELWADRMIAIYSSRITMPIGSILLLIAEQAKCHGKNTIVSKAVSPTIE